MKDIIKKVKKLDYSFELENKIMQAIIRGHQLNTFLKSFINVVNKIGLYVWTFLGLGVLAYSMFDFVNSTDSEIFMFLVEDLSLATSYLSELINIVFNNFGISIILGLVSFGAIIGQKKLANNLLERKNG